MERSPAPSRKIIQVDMDAFQASVKARDELRPLGVPLAVAEDGPRRVLTPALPAGHQGGGQGRLFEPG